MAKVLFVCTGNVCRSPMAEGLYREMTKQESGIEVASAGISAMDGLAPSDYSVLVMRKWGIDISRQRSRQLTPKMVAEATHIFVMATGHKLAVETMYPAAAEKTFLLLEPAAGDDAIRDAPWSFDVPDPIGHGPDVYESTLQLIRASMPSLIEFVKQTDAKTEH
jgi:protein-tyrosine-phosphatase